MLALLHFTVFAAATMVAAIAAATLYWLFLQATLFRFTHCATVRNQRSAAADIGLARGTTQAARAYASNR